MPSTRLIAAISTSIRMTLPPEMNSTSSVIIRPRPVSVIVPTTMPAVAVAMRDADHVARAERKSVDQIGAGGTDRAGELLVAENRHQRLAGRDDAEDRHRRPEGRQAGRHLLDHQAPEQDGDGDEEIEPGAGHVPGARQLQDRRVRVVERKVGIARRIPDGGHIERDAGNRRHSRRGARRRRPERR